MTAERKMEKVTTSNLFKVLLLVASMALVSCAKKLPVEESDDIKDNVIDMKVFDQSSSIKAADTQGIKAIQSEIGGVFALNEKELRPVEYISGPEKLKIFFKDLKIEGLAAGQEYKIIYKLTKNYMVAYLDKSGVEVSTQQAEASEQNGSLIPIFQYPVSSYGIKRRQTNSLGDETRNVEYVTTNKDSATFVRIDTLVKNRTLGLLWAKGENERKEYFLKRRIEARDFTVGQIRKFLKNEEAFKKSTHDDYEFKANDIIKAKVYEGNIYFYRPIKAAQLSEREKIIIREGFNIKLLKACSDRLKEALEFDSCHLRSEYKMSVSNVKLELDKDDDDQTIATVSSKTIDLARSNFVKITDFKITDTRKELIAGIPLQGNRFLYRLADIEGETGITISADEEVEFGVVNPLSPVNELKHFSTKYNGPKELKRFFKDFVIEAERSGETFKVVFKLNKTHILAFAKAENHKVSEYKSKLVRQGLIPLFQFPIGQYGYTEHNQDADGETIDISFEITDRENATHLTVLNTPENREAAGLDDRSKSTLENLFRKNRLNGEIFSARDLRRIFTNNHNLATYGDDVTFVTQIADHSLYILKATDKKDLDVIEKELLRKRSTDSVTANDPRMNSCTQQIAALSGIALNDCVLVARARVSVDHIGFSLDKNRNHERLVTAGIDFDEGKHNSQFVRILTDSPVKKYSLGQETGLEFLTITTKEELNNKSWTLAAAKAYFKGNSDIIESLFANSPIQSVVIGNYAYLKKAVSKESLSKLERGAIGSDPRYSACSAAQAEASGIAAESCIMKAVLSLRIVHSGLKITSIEDRDAGVITLDPSENSQNTNLIIVQVQSQMREFDYAANINLQDKVLLSKAEDIDFDAEYLYVPSTHEAPKDMVAADPFFQGQEKIVKLKMTEDGLDVIEIEDDERFDDNDFNHSPVLTIPGSHVDFTCYEDGHNRCTDQVVFDSDASWKDTKFFVPNLDRLTVKEVNTLNLYTVNAGCIYQTGSKATHYEIKKGVINVEIERTFRISEKSRCIIMLFYTDNLKSASFKVKYFYSLVKLDDLASKDYEIVDYPVTEHSDFGFFKNQVDTLNDDFDSQRKDTKYFLNRFNPKKSEIKFELSESFGKESNSHILEATKKVVTNINKTLREADAGIQLTLGEPKKIFPGDLRNNSIVLIDDPLANGLLGYGPSVTNPRTGEIVQAHTNMYGGVLKSMSRFIWDNMVDLSIDIKKEREANAGSGSGSGDAGGDNPGGDNPGGDNPGGDNPEGLVVDFEASKLKLAKFKNKLAADMAEASIANNVEDLHERQMQLARVHADRNQAMVDDRREALQLNALDIFGRTGKENQREVEDFMGEDGKIALNLKNGHEKMLEKYSKNNAYHKDFLLSANLGKTFIAGILEMEGVLNADGTLKRWNELTDEQKALGSKLIVTHSYTQTLTHEIGHNLGLRHNFEGSFDSDNFYTKEEAEARGVKRIPRYSSIMDYGFSELNELPFMGKYDRAALRFGYGRKAENKDGTTVEIKTNLTDLKNSAEGQNLKRYGFCTDQNAGLNVSCNRFDEGATYTEIAEHFIKKYKDFYKYRNFRNDRPDFSTYGTGGYVMARIGEFRRMRTVLEMFELYASFIPLSIMAEGCSPDLMAAYPDLCKTINDLSKSSQIIGNFFLEVLKTPDHSCALAKKEEPNTVVELRRFLTIYNKIKYDIDKTILTDCFAPEVATELDKEGLVVVAQGGKSLVSYKGTDPRYRYASDIDVRGIWPDKLMAMRGLMNRQSFTSSTESDQSSFMEHPAIAPKVENFLRHIMMDTQLQELVAFTTKDGKKVNLPYKLNEDNYLIPEQAALYPIVAFRLPFRDSAKLNEMLMKTAFMANYTTDPSYEEQSEKVIDLLSIIRRDVVEGVPNASLPTVEEGRYVYAARPSNSLASEMIDTINLEAILKEVGKEKVAGIMQRRLNPAKPDDLTEVQNHAWDLEIGLVNAIIGAIQNGTVLDRAFLVTNFGEEMADKILAVYAMGVEEIQKVLAMKIAASGAPADATDAEKKLYATNLNILNSFLTDKLDAQVQLYKKNIEMLVPLRSLQ